MRREKTELVVDFDEKDFVQDIYFRNKDSKEDRRLRKIDSFILSFWEKKSNDSFHIELWTKKLFVHEMKQLCVATIHHVGKLVQRATNDQALGQDIIDFAKVLEKRIQKDLK